MAQNEKWLWLPYRITETRQLEHYLGEMAEKGWYPVYLGEKLAKFRQGRPRTLRYAIDFTDIREEDDLRHYTALCADAGWRFRMKGRGGWMLFMARNPETPPLQTDPMLAVKNYQNFFWNNFGWNGNWAVIWIMMMILNWILNRDQVIRWISGWHTMLELGAAALLILLLLGWVWNALASLRGYFAMKKALKTETPVPDFSEKSIRSRIRKRKIQLTLGILIGVSAVGYDIWAGNISPAWEQITALLIGAGVAGTAFLLKKRWAMHLARETAWCISGIFLAMGLILSYPRYRMEAVTFSPEDPVVQVSEFLPEAEISTREAHRGKTPLYEYWDLRQSGSVPVSENVYDGMTIDCTAYRAASPKIAERLLWEEIESFQSLFHDMRPVPLGWEIDEAYRMNSTLLLRDGCSVIICMPWSEDDPEVYREALLKKLEILRNF